MFGLENKPGKDKNGFTFELEREMMDPTKGKNLLLKIEKRINQIKDLLRKGEAKETFQMLGTLLYGYASMVKVISRANSKKRP